MSKKILILDDDVDFNTLLTDVFTQAECDVISAHDPQKALSLIQEKPVDVIVTDQRMPWSDAQKPYHLQREVIGINR